MPNQHTRNPLGVRMPTSLEAWYRRTAKERGQYLNALLVEALEEKRQREEQIGNGTTTRATTSRPRKAAPAAARKVQPYSKKKQLGEKP